MANSNSRTNREWYPPNGDTPALLKLYNSLVDEKVPFIPAAGAGSKQISWYACGPTVYDSAHMGHARNYVTFDVIRRVLEDYFGYNILYVMNVTDVDDKIILRARRNHLLQQYKQEQKDAQQVPTSSSQARQFLIPIVAVLFHPCLFSSRLLQRVTASSSCASAIEIAASTLFKLDQHTSMCHACVVCRLPRRSSQPFSQPLTSRPRSRQPLQARCPAQQTAGCALSWKGHSRMRSTSRSSCSRCRKSLQHSQQVRSAGAREATAQQWVGMETGREGGGGKEGVQQVQENCAVLTAGVA